MQGLCSYRSRWQAVAAMFVLVGVVIGFRSATFAGCAKEECDEVGAWVLPQTGDGVVFSWWQALNLCSPGPLGGSPTPHSNKTRVTWTCDGLTAKCNNPLQDKINEAVESYWDGSVEEGPSSAYGNCIRNPDNIEATYCADGNGVAVNGSWEKN